MAQWIAAGFGHENHVGAGGEERFRPDDRHRAAEPVLIEKHGRGVVTVIAVEEYERLTGKPAAKQRPVENEKNS